MHDINLILKKDRKKTLRIVFGVLLLIVVSAVFFYYGIYGLIVYREELQYRAVEAGMSLTPQMSLENENNFLKKEIERLEKEKSELAIIPISSEKWSRIFEKIEEAVPKAICISSITYDGFDVTIEGFAPSDVEVAQMSVNLVNSGIFSKVRINRITGAGGTEGVNFLMVCTLGESGNAKVNVLTERLEDKK